MPPNPPTAAWSLSWCSTSNLTAFELLQDLLHANLVGPDEERRVPIVILGDRPGDIVVLHDEAADDHVASNVPEAIAMFIALKQVELQPTFWPIARESAETWARLMDPDADAGPAK